MGRADFPLPLLSVFCRISYILSVPPLLPLVCVKYLLIIFLVVSLGITVRIWTHNNLVHVHTSLIFVPHEWLILCSSTSLLPWGLSSHKLPDGLCAGWVGAGGTWPTAVFSRETPPPAFSASYLCRRRQDCHSQGEAHSRWVDSAIGHKNFSL